MRTKHGFTLVELMVTIAVLGIVATMAAPSFSSMLAKQRLDGAAKNFANTLTDIRVQAMTRRVGMAVCPNQKTATNGNTVTNDACAELMAKSASGGGATAYNSLSATEKTALKNKIINENRILLADISKDLTLKSNSSTAVVFRYSGTVDSAADFNLCSGTKLIKISVSASGSTTLTGGSC